MLWQKESILLADVDHSLHLKEQILHRSYRLLGLLWRRRDAADCPFYRRLRISGFGYLEGITV